MKLVAIKFLAAVMLTVGADSAWADCISGNVGVCNNQTETYNLNPGDFSKAVYSFSGGTKIAGGTFTSNYITITWNTPGSHTLTVEEFNPNVPYRICSIGINVYTVAGGTLSSSSASVCQGSGTNLSLSGYSGYIQYWEKTTDGVNWETISHTGTTYGTGGLSVATTYRALVNQCSADAYSSEVTVSVVVPSPGGVSVSNGSFCQGESVSGTATASGFSGIVQRFQKSEYTGGVWGTWTDAGGMHDVNYFEYSVSVPTRFRAVIASGTCSTIYSGYGEVQSSAASIAGSISGPTVPVCPGVPFSLSLNGSQGTVQAWYSRTSQGSYGGNIGTPTNITVSQPTYFKAAVKNTGCATTAETQEFLVSVKAAPVGGSLSASTTNICQGSSSTLTLSGYSVTIKRWEKTTDGGVTWQPISHTGASYGTGSLTVTTTFRVIVENECGTTTPSSQVTIAVTTPPDPGTASVTSGSSSVCGGESASGTVTVSGYTGFVQTWEKSEYVNGSWGAYQPTGSGHGANYYDFSVTVPTRFRAVFPGGSCPTQYSAAEISIATPTTAGYITGPAEVCPNASFNLTLNANVGALVNWWVKDDTHDWAIDTPPFDIIRNSQFKAEVKNGNCLTKETPPFTVAIKAPPVMGTLSPALTEVCEAQPINIGLSTYTGTSIQWMKRLDGAEGFSTVATNTSMSFSETAQTAEWLAVVSNVCGVTRTSNIVKVKILPAPPKPVNITDSWIYESGSARLEVSLASNTLEAKWYAEPAATGIPVGTATVYQTPSLLVPHIYYVRSVNDIGCASDTTQVRARFIHELSSPSNLRTEVVRVDGVRDATQMNALTGNGKHTRFTYFDGLGRTVQTVAMAATPAGKDLVQPVEYDVFGRVPKQYLPYAATVGDGSFKGTYKADQASFYTASADKVANDAKPYSITKFERSPLERVREQGAPGVDWQPGTGHTSTIGYSFNTGATADAAEEVRRFNADGTSTQFFTANKLHRTETTDANGNKTITFTDTQGRTIGQKVQLDELIDGVMVNYLETYYVYDDMGREKYIISPKGVAVLKGNGWTLTASILDQYVHQFVYDLRGRLVEKKVPGQAWMYNVYDKLNRLVLTQDGLLRNDSKWLFVKYDKRGRVVMQGLYKNTTLTTRASMQLYADGLYADGNASFPFNAWYETRGTVLHGYTNTSFPKLNGDNTSLEVLNVNYYDSYDFDNNGTGDFSYSPQSLLGEGTAIATVAGLPTGAKRLVIGSTTWLYNYVFYDKYYRTIQVRSSNHLSTAADNLTTIVYDFEGKVLIRKTDHNAGQGRANTVVNSFTYDEKGRLWKVFQNSQLVAQYAYNELGQVVDKKLHNTTGTDFLQSVDLRYTLHGQLSSINNAQLTTDADLNDDTGDYFGMELLYNNVESGLNNDQHFNGNIAAIKWKGIGAETGADDQKSYKYTYDKSGKLKTATYQMHSGAAWSKEAGVHNETMSYDHNGNIRSLQRNARKHQLDGVIASYTNETIDNLTYAYNGTYGDRLDKVEDAATGAGFSNGTSGTTTDYAYDLNGNLTADKNKGIDSIHYNFLGKVRRIKFSDGRVITYTYDAAGSKLKMRYYEGAALRRTTDYVDGFVYEDGALSFFGSPEGRVATKETGQNLIANGDANSTSGFTPLLNVTLSSVTIGTETYVSATCNQSTSTPGIYPIGGMITAQPGERYVLRVKGYTSGTNVYLRVTTNLGNLVYPGAILPAGAANEAWVSNQFVVPPGATYFYVGAVWSGFSDPILNQSMYINKIEVIKITESYEYAIADHQGNTRVVFTSDTPTVQSPATGFESDPGTLHNFPTGGNRSPLPLFNQTAGGMYSNLLNGGNNSQVGVGKSFKVYPGDKVKIQAYAKYEAGGSSTSGAFALALLNAFNLPAPAGGETGTPSSGLNYWGELIDEGVQNGGTQAFVNIVVFDKNHDFLDAAWDQIDASAVQVGASPDVPHDELMKEYSITEEGYVYLYISNNSPVNVYFDDVTITHTPTNVIQYNEYYPFGLQAGTSWTRENHRNDYLYNEGNELNQSSGWYETFFRGYDPALGRFLQVDPLATMYASHSGYNYALNDPVLLNDPMGDRVDQTLPDYVDWATYMQGAPTVGPIGPGSGNFWTDGSAYSDWSVNGGSQMYRDGLANGLTDIGGRLYSRTRSGYVQAEERNGELYAWEDYTGTDVSYYVNDDGDLVRSTVAVIGSRMVAQQGDPLRKHMDQAVSLNAFLKSISGLSYDEVTKMLGDRSMTSIGSQPGGPTPRYVINPHDGNVIDMRHMLVVGYKYGSIPGIGIEIGQLLGKDTRPSAMDAQDFYSNDLGSNFWFTHSLSVALGSQDLAYYLRGFFEEPTHYNHKWRYDLIYDGVGK